MRVAGAEALGFSIPLARPLQTARGPILARRGWVIRLTADDGTVGLGEAAPHPHAPRDEVRRESALLHEAIAPLRGAALTRVDEILVALGEAPAWISSAVDTALLDLVSRRRGLSAAEHLGGSRRRRVPVNALLESADSADLVAEARRLAAAGFTHAKRKASPAVEATRAEVEALAAVPQLSLRIDANGVWSESEARRACRACALPNVEWVEQPIAPGDVGALARVRQDSSVRIAADEQVTDVDVARALLEAQACDALVLKLVQVGGPSVARRVAEMAGRSGVPVAVTSGIDTGIGIAAALAVAATVPGTLAACGLATGPLLAGDLVWPSIPVAPSMAVPAGPGLGVELDPAACARFLEEGR